jgi:hypothetical protein
MAKSLALVLLFALSTASAEESCAVAGNCPEALDFEGDGALGLLQAKVFAHHAMKSEAKDVPFATQATNAEYAENAESAENARTAAMAVDAFVAGNAKTAIVAKKAVLADQALEAEHACEIDASLDDGSSTDDKAKNDGADEDPYSKVCDGAKSGTVVATATNARCAGTAVQAENAFNAMVAHTAVEAGNASHAMMANNADFAYYAKEAGAAIVAKSAKNTELLSRDMCAQMQFGLNNISYDASTAAPFAKQAYNALYAGKAEYAFEANTSAGAENAFAAANATNAKVATKAMYAEVALAAGAACIVDSSIEDTHAKVTGDDDGVHQDPYASECGSSADPTTVQDHAVNAHCAGEADNAAFALEAMVAKNAVAAGDADNAMFAQAANFAEFAGEAGSAIYAKYAKGKLSAKVCEEMGSGVNAKNRNKLESKLREKDAAFGGKSTQKLGKKAMSSVAKLGGRFRKA